MNSHRYRSTHTTGLAVRRGFTLIEMMIVMFIVALIVLFGYPALNKLTNKSKLLGAATETTNGLRLARYQAIKHSRPTIYSIDPTVGSRLILAWVDDNDDTILDPGEQVLMRTTLRAGLYLCAPSGAPADAIIGFQGTNQVRFNTDGSVDAVGAYRFCDHDTNPRNYLEVDVRPQSVARAAIRKWDGAKWWSRDEGPNPWVWY